MELSLVLPTLSDHLVVTAGRLEEGVRQDCYGHLDVLSDTYLPMADLLYKQGCLIMTTTTREQCWHVLVTSISGKPVDHTHWQYRLSLRSPLACLDLQPMSRVYADISVLDVLQATLQRWPQINYRLACQHGYSTQPNITQYRETDWVFLQRLVSEFGIYYRWHEMGAGAELVIYDGKACDGDVHQYRYCDPAGMAQGEAVIHSIETQSDESGVATVLTGTVAGVEPGDYCQVNGVVYPIHRVQHQVTSHKTADRRQRVLNYQSLLLTQLNVVAGREKVRGLLSGYTTTTVDAHGDYRFKPAYAQMIGTPPSANLVLPSGGVSDVPEGHGCHFPLRPNSHAAIGMLEGDINQPVLLGVMTSMTHPSPVSHENPNQTIIASAGGQRLMFDDTVGEEHLQLNIADDRAHVRLGQQSGSCSVDVVHRDGELQFVSASDCSLDIDCAQTLQIDNDSVIESRHYKSVSDSQQTLQAGDRFVCTAGRDITIASDNAEWQSQDEFAVQVGGELAMAVRQGALALRCQGEQLQFASSAGISLSAPGGMVIDAGGVHIALTPSGDVILEAGSIDLAADRVVIQAESVREG